MTNRVKWETWGWGGGGGHRTEIETKGNNSNKATLFSLPSLWSGVEEILFV